MDLLPETMVDLSMPGVPDSPRLRNLMDLSTGNVRTRDSSYVGTTNEVNAMMEATKDSNLRWPGLWYELLQGAWDYNDWGKGPPEIMVYFEGSRDPIPLHEFIKGKDSGGPLGRLFAKKVERVEVSNHLKSGTGLRPRHIALTEHDAQDRSTDTLGLHGRGLSIAATASLARFRDRQGHTHGPMAEKVTLQSYTEDIGTWYGETRLVTDDIDPTFPPSLQIRYKNDQSLQSDRTVITVHKPDSDLIEALRQLPNWFLPTNPRYRFHRLDQSRPHVEPNRLTVFASSKNQEERQDKSFTSSDLSGMGHRGLEKAKGVEPARVEIIPRELFTSAQKIDFVFVDGLRVEVEDAEFSQIWSFWGFSNGTKDGYNPRRSNDSLSLDGGIRDLVGNCLARNENRELFADIIASSTAGMYYEGNVFDWNLDVMERFPEAQNALVAAWEGYRSEKGLPDGVFITSDRSEKARADRENKPTIYLNSSAFVNRLVRYVEGLEKVDDVFAREAIEAQKRHWLEMDELRKKHDAERAEWEREREQQIVVTKRERGIEKEAAATGEVLKIRVPDDWRDTLTIAQLHLMHALGVDQGYVQSSTEKGGLVIAMNDGAIDTIPVNSNELGVLTPFIRDFIVIFGDYVDVDVRIMKRGKGVYFRFSKDENIDADRNATLHVQRGTLAKEGESFVTIDFIPNERYQKLVDSATLDSMATAYRDFLQTTISDIEGLLGDGNHIDQDKYLTSQFAQEYPPCLALIRTRRQLEEVRQQAESELKNINAARRAAGLPLLAFEASELNAPNILQPSRKVTYTQETVESPEQTQVTYTIEDEARSAGSVELRAPDSGIGLSIIGEKNKDEVVEVETPERRLEREIDAVFEKTLKPDFSLQSGDRGKTRGYLMSHLNPEYSNVTTDNYQVLTDIPFGKEHKYARLVFRKKITGITGVRSLYIPPGFEPVGYYHSKGEIDLRITGIPEKRVYGIYIEKGDIPEGLEIYYKKVDQVDTALPAGREVGEIVDLADLNSYWRELINAVREAKMTDKAKNDILLRGWTRAYSYLNKQTTFNQFNRAVPKEFAAQIINIAQGDCGYCMRGFTGLVRSAGFGSRERGSYLSSDGDFNQFHNYHGLNEVYLDGKWVLVEPQVGYLDDGYEIDPIPKEYRDQFESLLAAIPGKRSLSARILAAFHETLGGATEKKKTQLPALFADETQVLVQETEQARIIRMRDLHGQLSRVLDETGTGSLELSADTLPAILDKITLGKTDKRRVYFEKRFREILEQNKGAIELNTDSLDALLVKLTENPELEGRELTGLPPILDIDRRIENAARIKNRLMRAVFSGGKVSLGVLAMSEVYKRFLSPYLPALVRQVATFFAERPISTDSPIPEVTSTQPDILRQVAARLAQAGQNIPGILADSTNIVEQTKATLAHLPPEAVVFAILAGVGTGSFFIGRKYEALKQQRLAEQLVSVE